MGTYFHVQSTCQRFCSLAFYFCPWSGYPILFFPFDSSCDGCLYLSCILLICALLFYHLHGRGGVSSHLFSSCLFLLCFAGFDSYLNSIFSPCLPLLILFFWVPSILSMRLASSPWFSWMAWSAFIIVLRHVPSSSCFCCITTLPRLGVASFGSWSHGVLGCTPCVVCGCQLLHWSPYLLPCNICMFGTGLCQLVWLS